MSHDDSADQHQRQLSPDEIEIVARFDDPSPERVYPRPITESGKPNPLSVQPGQPERDILVYLNAWKNAHNSTLADAAHRYAGVLGKTEDKDQSPEDHAKWLATCTPRQRSLLDKASKTKRRARWRAEYAAKKTSEGKSEVREYVRGLSPEDQAERRRLQNADSAQRRRDKVKAEKLAPPAVPAVAPATSTTPLSPTEEASILAEIDDLLKDFM
jgi:hypothetical protein